MNNNVTELKNVFIKQAKEIFKTKSTKIFFKGFFDVLKIDKDIKFVSYDTTEQTLAFSTEVPYNYKNHLGNPGVTTTVYMSLLKADSEDIIVVSRVPIIPLRVPKYREWFTSWINLSSGWFGNEVKFGEFAISNSHQPSPVFGEMIRSEMLNVKKSHFKTLLERFHFTEHFTEEQTDKVIEDIMSPLTDNILDDLKALKDKNMKLFMKCFFFRETLGKDKEQIILIPVFAFGNKTLHFQTHKVFSYEVNLPVLV